MGFFSQVKQPENHAVESLVDGAKQLASDTEELAAGTQKVKAGAQRLTVGINLLATSQPSCMQHSEGSAEGMAHSVQPKVEVDADVPNQGSSFAPNVIPAALWLGAGIAAIAFASVCGRWRFVDTENVRPAVDF